MRQRSEKRGECGEKTEMLEEGEEEKELEYSEDACGIEEVGKVKKETWKKVEDVSV